MSCESLKNNMIDLAAAGTLLGGAFLGATHLAEYEGRDYSVEKVEAYKQELDAVYGEIGATIGEGNVCMQGVSRLLRAEGSFPDEREEIQEVFDQACPEEDPISDVGARVIESYKADVGAIQGKLDEQSDWSNASIYERIAFGYFGLAGGFVVVMAGSFSLKLVEDIRGKSQKSKIEMDQEEEK